MKRLLRIFLALVATALLLPLGYLGQREVRGVLSRRAYAARLRDAERREGGRQFFVSPRGSDEAEGVSPERAWRSIARVNREAFAPGDRVLFEGGQAFEGTLLLDEDDTGTPSRPISVGSYGEGRARLVAGSGDGIKAHNTGGVHVADLEVVGEGREVNRGSGVAFVNDLAGDVKIEWVRIERVEVWGFGKYGVLVDGNNGRSGFRNVRITDTEAHDNAVAGVYVYGAFSRLSSAYAHEDVYVGRTRAYNNSGVPGPNLKNTGSGIVLSDVDGGVIEDSVAFNNGWLCDATQGGPVGIWAWDSNRILIQRNESYRNRTNGPHDGGGFDLDGGTTNSIMQYNYSHDNDGAGYLLAQYTFARAHGGNTVRYNVSENDARKNGHGSIHVWGDVREAMIHNNTVFLSPSVDGNSAAITFGANERALFFERRAATNVKVWNNLFQTTGGAALVAASPDDGVLFQGNNYFAAGESFRILWGGVEYRSLSEWRAATMQERDDDSKDNPR